MHVCIYACAHVCENVCMYIDVCICVYIDVSHMCICVYVCTCVPLGMCLCVGICVCVYVYILNMCVAWATGVLLRGGNSQLKDQGERLLLAHSWMDNQIDLQFHKFHSRSALIRL